MFIFLSSYSKRFNKIFKIPQPTSFKKKTETESIEAKTDEINLIKEEPPKRENLNNEVKKE